MKAYKYLISSSFDDFKRNKARTLLTSLGITVGVLSVVMLIALGLGLKNYIQGQFESLGANLVMVMPGSGFTGGGFGAGIVGGAEFDEKDVNSLSRISGAKYVVPLFFKSSSVEAGGDKKFAYIMGVNENYFKLMNVETVAGVLFTKSEVAARAKMAVLGYSAADDLFENPQDAVGKTIRVESLRLKVIGVIKKNGRPGAGQITDYSLQNYVRKLKSEKNILVDIRRSRVEREC